MLRLCSLSLAVTTFDRGGNDFAATRVYCRGSWPRRLAIAWPKHLARRRPVCRPARVRSCVQELGAALAWLDRGWFVKFSVFAREGKI